MKLLFVIIAVLVSFQVISTQNTNKQTTQKDQFDFFSFFDTDNDNQITYVEFQVYMGTIPEVVEAIPESEGKDWRENVRWAFLVYDNDKNEIIDRDEFKIFEEQMYALNKNAHEEEIL